MSRPSSAIEKQLEAIAYAESVAERMAELQTNQAFQLLLKIVLQRREEIATSLAVARLEDVPRLQGRLQELMFFASRPDEQEKSLTRLRADRDLLRGELRRAMLHQAAYPGDPDIEAQKERAGYGTEHPVREL